MKTTLLTVALALGTAATCAAQIEGSFDRSLTVSGPVDLDVVTDSGGITVTPGSSGSVHVHAILKAQHGWFDSGDVERHIREIERNPPIEQNGNQIRIGYVHSRELLKNISMRLEIQTPSETKLRARADSGGIRVEGIQGPADCHTDSGGIDVRNVGSEVHAAADSGGIHIENVKGATYARVDSGGIEANDIAGSIDAETDSGGIHLSQSSAAPIRAKADSGGVTVRLASNAGYDLSVESESGHISVPEISVHGDISKHHVEGKVRGGGPMVNVRVDSGNVSID
ncbi:MAG TPA: DUF4097 family beta strand repeat-containing protein [Bryobacteraceae bacterium]|nr:DUF4097 family beta strand repeat-containing protein [Bryobacteraceae bacterium]